MFVRTAESARTMGARTMSVQTISARTMFVRVLTQAGVDVEGAYELEVGTNGRMSAGDIKVWKGVLNLHLIWSDRFRHTFPQFFFS